MIVKRRRNGEGGCWLRGVGGRGRREGRFIRLLLKTEKRGWKEKYMRRGDGMEEKVVLNEWGRRKGKEEREDEKGTL